MKTISISQRVAAAVNPARGVDAASPSERQHADLFVPTLPVIRELKRTEVRAPLLVLAVLVFSSFAAFAQVNLNIGTLPAGKSVRIIFQTTITNPVPGGVTQISSSGTVSGGNFPNVTAGPAITPLFVPPLFTSANNTTFTVGSAGTFTVTASGIPAPTFVRSGALPGGVAFNTNSGVLNGTPAGGTGGTYPLIFTAHNSAGSDATQNFTLTVNRPPVAGSAFTMGVKIGVPSTVKIIGGKHSPTDADNDPLTITGVTGAANGIASTDGTNVTYTATGGSSDSFACAISDGRGGTASQTVSVSITSSGSTGYNQISAQSLGGGTNVLTFLGTPNFNYALERATNLVPPVVWLSQVTNAAQTNGWLIFTNVTSESPVFYRTRYVP